MIADTNFLIELYTEQASRKEGPASAALQKIRSNRISTTIISAGEFAAGFASLEQAREFLAKFPTIRLFPESCYEASRIDRELMRGGKRMGENDNWIAGIARYYGKTLLTRDRDFRRVKGLKLLEYA